VILDTPVASGSVHSPYKQPVGQRMARGALAVAYGMTELAAVDPIATKAVLTAKEVVVTIGGLGKGGVQAKVGAVGFEVLGADQVWHSTPVAKGGGSSVTVGPAPPGALAVRYLFYSSPCGLQPYQCPVYTDVAPMGSLTGEVQDFLPLGPFVMKLTID